MVERTSLALLLILVSAPMATAAFLEDPPGDVAVHLAESYDAPDATGRLSATDVLALDIEEDADAFHFHITHGGWTEGTQVMLLDEGRHWVFWSYGAIDYGLLFRRLQTDDGPVFDAILNTIEDGEATRIKELDYEMDDAGVLLHVPRLDIVDERGASPRPGEVLAGVEVHSFGAGTLFLARGDVRGDGDVAVVRSSDRMGPPTDWAVMEGVRQEGDLELWSPDPMRLSNGQAGAFVFDARLRSSGAGHVATLGLEHVPDGWTVELPFQDIEVPAGGEVRVPVVVSIPFAHQHGGLDTMLLTATDGAHVGRIEKGIRFTAVPQPAGHHDVLYFHTDHGPAISLEPMYSLTAGGDPTARAFLNTLETDETDEDVPVPGEGNILPGGTSTVTWDIPLRPGLAMGLDFAGGTGTVAVRLEYAYAATDLVLGGELRVGDRPVAEILPGDPVDVTRGQTELTGQVVPIADRIPYVKGQDLVLHLVVNGTFTGPISTPDAAPALRSGGSMHLPLEEYQDAPESLASPELGVSVDDGRREANPGDAILFRFAAASLEPRTVDVSIAGSHADWARLGTGRLHLPDGTFEVAVQVPEDAAVGDAADLVVTLVDADDPAVRAIARATVLVTDEPVDGDPGAEALLARSGAKESPGVGVLLLPALAAVAWRRR